MRLWWWLGGQVGEEGFAGAAGGAGGQVVAVDGDPGPDPVRPRRLLRCGEEVAEPVAGGVAAVGVGELLQGGGGECLRVEQDADLWPLAADRGQGALGQRSASELDQGVGAPLPGGAVIALGGRGHDRVQSGHQRGAAFRVELAAHQHRPGDRRDRQVALLERLRRVGTIRVDVGADAFADGGEPGQVQRRRGVGQHRLHSLDLFETDLVGQPDHLLYVLGGDVAGLGGAGELG